MHDTSNDNFICEAVGLVAEPSDKRGFGFVEPKKKIVEHGNGNAYVDFEHNEKLYLKSKEAFAHHRNIISDEPYKRLYAEDVVTFKLYNGPKGLYATDIRKIDTIFDENGFIKDLSQYGINQVKN
ncbi:MAG: cold shock domain-containing protein [Pseudoalteromonas sp.]|uniref:cold-shock protein n=1 Tax=Pseudoalteromonas sp. TaxID=53249 RepID=UPI001D76524B|nr:cold shock domain-containing protein [Pseudoalteromonas sp.]NRA76903.1 cold shock domain-containing protein [Pseudoalteromonas sp.]